MKIKHLLIPAIFLVSMGNLFANTNPPDTLANNIIIPDAFTPNKAGAEKIYYIRSLDRNAIKSIKMQIYTRWGQLVFETDNIDQGWDGTYKEKESAEGVYYYTLKAEVYSGNITRQIIKVDKKGYINLLR